MVIFSRENLGWASICNNAGATTGVLIGNSLFLVLESGDFCNEYIRPVFGLNSHSQGLITLKGALIVYQCLFYYQLNYYF